MEQSRSAYQALFEQESRNLKRTTSLLAVLLVASFAVSATPTPPVSPTPNPQPVDEPGPVPAASTGSAPDEVWLPRRLTMKEEERRTAADALLMESEHRDDQTAFLFTLQKELLKQQYDLIETQLDDVLAKSLADPSYELVERDATAFTDGYAYMGLRYTPPIDKEVIDAWVQARPNSPWAHLNAGDNWNLEAWGVRGDDFADQVTSAQWNLTHIASVSARTELRKALKLNPKIASAWSTLLSSDIIDGGMKSLGKDYAAGSKQRPANTMLPDRYENGLQPRWYGSHDEMDAFAKKVLTRLDKNPRMWSFQGFSAADQACDDCESEEWTSALTHYNDALAYGDRVGWLTGAGKAAMHLRHYALAYRYFERSNAYIKSDTLGTLMLLMRGLCDPTWDLSKVELLKQEMVKYGDMPQMAIVRDPKNCVYYQAELPWSDEPIPDSENVKSFTLLMPKPTQSLSGH